MKRIFKYPVRIDDRFTIDMPEGAQLLTVQVQRNEPQLWALVDEDAAKEPRAFALRGTGHPAELDDAIYVGSFQLHGGALVFHLFDLGMVTP